MLPQSGFSREEHLTSLEQMVAFRITMGIRFDLAKFYQSTKYRSEAACLCVHFR